MLASLSGTVRRQSCLDGVLETQIDCDIRFNRYKVVPTLCSVLGDAFPEIVRGQETVMAVLQGEERDFNRTIDKGARFFAKKADALPAGSMFPGKDAFHLSGSLGFPLDLTQIMAEERGVTVTFIAASPLRVLQHARLSLSPSLRLSVSPSLRLSVSPSLSLCLSVPLSLSLSV